MENDHLVIFINELLSASLESDLPSTAPIFRVPARLRSANEAAYDPTVIAIGPLHCKDKQLKKMECLKQMYLKRILQSKDNKWVNQCQKVIRDSEEKARACYAEAIRLSKIEFEKMLLLDGIFIIGFLRQYNQVFYGKGVAVSKNDPIFNNSNRVKHVLRDLVLLENQIPLFVLRRLFELLRDGDGDGDGEISDLIQPLVLFKDEFPRGITSPLPDVEHLLGLVHYVHCSFFARTRNPATEVEGDGGAHGSVEFTSPAVEVVVEGGAHVSMEITSPTIEAEVEGDVRVSTEITSPTTEVEVEGDVHVSTEITSPTTELEVEGDAHVSMDITSPTIEVGVEGDTDVNTEITSPTTELEVEGNAHVNTEITSPTTEVEVEGEAHVNVEITSPTSELEEEGDADVSMEITIFEEGNVSGSNDITSHAAEEDEGSGEMASPAIEDECSAYGSEENISHSSDVEEAGDLGIKELTRAAGDRIEELTRAADDLVIEEFISSATEMAEAGIYFKRPRDKQLQDTSWLDIKLKSWSLYIPKLEISDSTEVWFRNMIAYEYNRPSKHPKYVTDYALTMQCLIQSTEDVKLLRRKRIIRNCLGGDEKVYNLFSNLVSNTGRPAVNFTYQDVFDRVNLFRQRSMSRLVSHIYQHRGKILSAIIVVVLLFGGFDLHRIRI